MIKTITVFGGGNIGTYFACVAAQKGYAVTVYSSKPEIFHKDLQIVNQNGEVTATGTLSDVTDDVEKAMNSDLLFVAYPSFMFSDFAEKILPYVKNGQQICVLPGTGGAEFSFSECIRKGAVLLGLQRVPAVARLREYGHTVCVEGKRDCLYVASIPHTYADQFATVLADLFDMKCESLPNYLCVTMTPSNPILHTSRLYAMFSDYEPGKTYEKNPLFYGEWTDASSEMLIACDAEHQNMLKRFDKMDLSGVKSLKLHYESETVPEMTAKLTSIQSLHNILSPMVQTENGFVPDFSSRYFSADFPYGLAIIEAFGDLTGSTIPRIRESMNWYRKASGNDFVYDLKQYGIHTMEDVYRLYR